MHPLDELKQHRNWIVCTADKTPWRADGLKKASPTDSADWCDYATAAATVAANPGLGLGFVLTRDAGFTVVDLDSYKTQNPAILAEHKAIHDGLQSYSEYSPSGKGIHIWLRGYASSRGLPKKFFELYSENHYMTVTFNPYRNVPIANLQDELTKFSKFYWPDSQNGFHPLNNEEGEESFDVLLKQEILQSCADAMNSEKWEMLWFDKPGVYNTKDNRYPLAPYKSHSEADLALCNILAFHCTRRTQVKKLYLQSPLAQSQKNRSRPKWLDDMVNKAWDRKIPVSKELTEGLAKQDWKPEPYQAPLIVDPNPEPDVPELPDLPQQWLNPTGLLQSIATYIYQSSLYPTAEVAMVASVALLAAITGRAYNTITGTGLNLYIALLANSGMGKEAAATGISALVKHCQTQCPAIDSFIGPSDIASPQALLKYMGNDKQGSASFYTHKGEIGMWLQKMNDKYIKHNEANLKAMLLDIYHKSGNKQQLQGSIYSDNTKNAPVVYSPAFSILGDSTPDEFWKAIDDRSLKDGLVSRFNIVECRNLRPIYQPKANELAPNEQLVWTLAGLANNCLSWNKIRQAMVVLEDEEARAYQLRYQKECQDKVWHDNTSPLASVWSRSHLKMLRLGALSAVGNNPQNPVVNIQDYLWARDFVEIGNRAIIKRHDAGEMGVESEGDLQRKAVAKELFKFCTTPYNPKWWGSYSVSPDMHKANTISSRMIHQKVCKLACFRHSKDYVRDLHNCLDLLCATGAIVKVTAENNSYNGRLSIGYKVLNVGGLE